MWHDDSYESHPSSPCIVPKNTPCQESNFLVSPVHGSVYRQTPSTECLTNRVKNRIVACWPVRRHCNYTDDDTRTRGPWLYSTHHRKQIWRLGSIAFLRRRSGDTWRDRASWSCVISGVVSGPSHTTNLTVKNFCFWLVKFEKIAFRCLCVGIETLHWNSFWEILRATVLLLKLWLKRVPFVPWAEAFTYFHSFTLHKSPYIGAGSFRCEKSLTNCACLFMVRKCRRTSDQYSTIWHVDLFSKSGLNSPNFPTSSNLTQPCPHPSAALPSFKRLNTVKVSVKFYQKIPIFPSRRTTKQDQHTSDSEIKQTEGRCDKEQRNERGPQIRLVADFEDVFWNLTQPTLYSHKEKTPKIALSNLCFHWQPSSQPKSIRYWKSLLLSNLHYHLHNVH